MTSAMIVAIAAAGVGAISLAADIEPPHGPIAVLFGTHVPLIIAAWRIANTRRGPLGEVGGFSLRLTWSILIYLSITMALVLALGVAAALSRVTVFIALAAAGLILIAVAARGASLSHDHARNRSVDWIWLPLCLITAIVATSALLHPQYDVDIFCYHLFFPLRWAQEHRIFIVPTWFSDFAPAYSPYASEIYFLSLLLPMNSDHMARGGQIVFWILLMAVLDALGRELRLRPWARMLSTGCVVLMPAIAWQAATANVDVALTAHLAGVALFSIRLARRRDGIDAAGLILCMGLAAGTKFLAMPYLVALAPLWIPAVFSFARRLREHSLEREISTVQLLSATAGAAWIGGFWYVRNWLVTGNPLYPMKVVLGGVTLFDGVFDRAVMLNSPFNYNRHGLTGVQQVMRDLIGMPAWFAAPASWDPATTSTIGAWSLLGLVFVATVLSIASPRFRIRYALPGLLVSIVAMVLLFWFVVPYQDPRFIWPAVAWAIMAIFAVIGRLPSRAGAGMMVVVGVGWLALACGQLFSTFVTKEAAAVAAAALLLFVIHRRSKKFGSWATACFCVTGIWAALAWIDRSGDPPRRAAQNLPRWLGFADAWKWVDEHAAGKTIAYAGHNIPYFWAGPHLQNRAIHVLAGGEPGWQFHDFAKSPAVRALGRPNVSDFAAHRISMDGRTWLRRLVSERVDYVVVSRLYRGPLIVTRHDAGRFPLEREWLDALANSRDASGRPMATRSIFGGGWLLFYRLNLPADESQWPALSSVVQTETDALDRRRRDATPPGVPIAGYPHSAEAIEETKLDVLP